MDGNEVTITPQEKQELADILKNSVGGQTPILADRPLSDQELGVQTPVTTPVNTPIDNTPVTTPVNTPAVETPTTPQLDINGYLKTEFEVDSPDVIKDWRKKAQELESLLPEYKSLKEQPPVSPYKSDFGKIADELFSQGVPPQTIARFNGIDLDKMSADDVLKLQLEVKNPKAKSEQIESVFKERYGVAEELSLTDGQIAEREFKKEEDATNARESLRHHISKAFSPRNTEPDPVLVRQETERSDFWKKDGLKQVKQDIFTITENGKMKVQGLQGIEEVEHNFKYEAPQEVKQAVFKELEAAVLNPANREWFNNTEDGIKNANAFIEARFLALDGKNIMKKQMEYVSERESKLHEHYAKTLHNPQNRNTNIPATPTQGGDVNSKAEDYIKKNG